MGFKLYNGCPNRELQDHWDSIAAARAEAKSLGIYLCWFPVEQKYAASTSMDNDEPYRELSGWHSTIHGALAEAKERLSENV